MTTSLGTCEMDGYADGGNSDDLYWHCEEEATCTIPDSYLGRDLRLCAFHATDEDPGERRK